MMSSRRAFVSVLLCALALPVATHAQVPSTDIFIASLAVVGDSLVVGPARNVTHREGYDNQPSFTADSRSLLYTVQSDGQTDIWRYDLRAGVTTQVTRTPESEYSATQMPGGRRFSVIRVERDSTQRLWSFAMDGSDPRLVLPTLKPVGYHLWLNKDQVVAFVLGTPATLHLVMLGGEDAIIARDIGRSLQHSSERGIFTYTQRDQDGLWITGLNEEGNPVGPPVLAPKDNEYHVWTPGNLLLTATEGRLVRWNGASGKPSGWLPVADLATNGVKNVSRLAVSPDGKWLAFVAEPVAR